MKRYIIYALVLMTVLVSCHKDDDPEPDVIDEPQVAGDVTLNVDVVLPASVQKQWQHSIDWAMSNIAKSQQKLSRKIKLNLRYHNEDTDNLDSLGYRLANPQEGDDTCHAIIGPYHSSNAIHLLRYARRNRLPVLMPTCSSAELQRTNALNTYAWFLTESDITQCEIMITAARALKTTTVALVYSDDSYGQSFRDWYAYYATEQGLRIAGGAHSYKKGDDLNEFMQEVLTSANGDNTAVLVALSDAADYRYVCDLCDAYSNTTAIIPICADTSLDENLFSNDDFISFNVGVATSASLANGFPQTYYGHDFLYPVNGDAQMYDALCIIALGAAYRAASPEQCLINGKQVKYTESPYTVGLTDYMRAVTGSEEGLSTQWDAAGLATAFDELQAGRMVTITGATGPLCFDSDTHTKILNTAYMLWTLNWEIKYDVDNPLERILPVLYMSTAGTSSEASTTEFWRLDKAWQQALDENIEQHVLPLATDNWAVIISPSTTWSNYRHQADAFAMYQLLRNHGYQDDHIVLVVEDNLAYYESNKYPGEIYVERGDADKGALVNDDVRKNVVVDYHFNDLKPEDIADIMLGRQSERLPHVIKPTETSNVFFFWSGHGGNREGPLWGNEDATEYFGTQRIHDIVSEMNNQNMYRRMMFAIETCFSGKWGEAISGLPDVLVLTAANPYEYSKADVHDKQMGVYLSNAFARTFRNQVDANHNILIYDLYRNLYRTTIGSHVTIYNQQQYGSVYEEDMSDFFPK